MTPEVATELDYTIIVPSRKRPHNMEVLRALLPSALICIDENELEDYRSEVPAENLLTHPPLPGALASVRNWMNDWCKTEFLVMADDDFQGVQSITGRRYITDPEEILAILENAMRSCLDLDLTAFTFSGTPNVAMLPIDTKPVIAAQKMDRVFGIRGRARQRRWDETLIGRADVDFTMRTLLEDRCVLGDLRFFFDTGPVFSGHGGNVGLVTAEAFEHTSRELKRRWGKSITFKPPGFVKKRDVASLGLRVNRHGKVAQR